MIPERWAVWIEWSSLLLGLAVGLAASTALGQASLPGGMLRTLVLLGIGVGFVVSLPPRRWAGAPFLTAIAAGVLTSYWLLGAPSRVDPPAGWWPDFGILVGAVSVGNLIGLLARSRFAISQVGRRESELDAPPT